MRVLFATGSAASYMLPPRLGDEQVNCGPDWADETAPDGQVRSLATPVGEYDLFALAARLPSKQQPDAVVCLVDASWRNLPRNLAAFKCPRVLLVADTHHLNSPLINMLRYATAEPFDRIVFLYDRHHAEFFTAAGLRNLYWFPGLTFPHGDAAVHAVRQARRRQEIMFVGQAGRFHPRRSRLLEALAARGLPVGRKAVPQSAGLGLYGASLLGFNASLNGDLNLRLFEILAAGAALLTDRLAPASGLTDLWADGREMLTYGSADELAGVAAHALAHPHETAAIGTAGAAWFDHHFNAERRRTAFQALALDGTALPEFALPAVNPTRVLFGGDPDRLIDALVVYEGIQELHREAETVQVTHAAGVPDDISSMWATLPRIQVSHEADAAEADIGVFDRTTEQVPAARSLWCWNAGAADGMRLAAAFAPHGFSRLSEQLALFGRNAAEPEPTPAADKRYPHVLLYTDDPEHGGVAHYNHSLLLALARAGHRVSCMQTQSESALVAAQRAAGVRHHWIDYDTSREFARTVTDGKAALRILAEDRPDLVIFSDCCPLSNLAAREAARQLGIPYVVVIGFVGAYLAETFAGQLPVLAAQYAAARAVVAVSQENLDLLRTRFGLAANHGQVIHYGRPEEFFKPRDEAVRARLRASLGVPAEAVVCFTAARLTGVKRHDLQLEALTQLMAGRTGSDLHFVWAGDGDQRIVLEKEIQQRGLARFVHLLGQRTDVRDWYDAADIFVLPSQLEGMPLAIMEAMAKGLPVVATAVSGIPEELGDTGKLLPDPAADPRGVVRGLVGTISNWAANPATRQAVGDGGRERANRMFREERMLERTLALVGLQWQASPPAAQPQGVNATSRSIAQPIVATPAGFVPQLTHFFKGPKLLQIDWRDSATATIIQHDDGSAAGTACEVKAAGARPRLPLPDGSVDTIFNRGSLARVEERALPGWLAELWRVTGRNLWLSVEATPGRDRHWWETKFFEAGFRKHPKLMEAVPYETLEHEGNTLLLLMEKIPAAGLARFPLSTLKAERGLHMDMTRESGRRSDAHIARYVLARQYLPAEGLVLDAACGLGYGCAVLACGNPALHVVGIDNSEFAVDYGDTTFRPVHPHIRFQLGDVCDLSAFADGSVGLVVSFETVEHLREPERFLQEIRRVLKPEGRFIGSVPNRWVDEHGKDPNPWHFHVFDFGKIVDLCGRFLSVHEVFNQTAGGGMKLPHAPRRIRRVNLPLTQGHDEAEWWLVAASREPVAAGAGPAGPKPAGTIMVLTHDPKHPLYASWLSQCPHPVVYETAAGLDFEFPPHVGLVVAHDCYQEPRASLLSKAMERGIPTLLLADGILEYRNTFEHPQIAPGVIYQPVRAHKVAGLGRSQARILESWGNAGRCEITGSARFDRYAALGRRQRAATEPFRVLVMTAITPYFTPVQHERVRQSLLDVKAFFARTTSVGGVPLQVEWRITQGLQHEIGVDTVVTDLSGGELAEVLQKVDAVISTPSTTMLEAMLLGLPVAVLDYCNCPHYVQPAWRITAEEHLLPTVTELVSPPAPKLLFQETTLHDALECATPATPRLLQLAGEMLLRGQRARAAGTPVTFPAHLLPITGASPAVAENRFDLAALYPGHPGFHEHDLRTLQVEVGQLRTYAAQLERGTGRAAGGNDLEKIKAQAQLTIEWRSKLEAAKVLSGLEQPDAAMGLLEQSLVAVQDCDQPDVALEAMIEVATELGRLDAAQARALLQATITLAQRLQRSDIIQRAAQSLEKLSVSVAAKEAACAT